MGPGTKAEKIGRAFVRLAQTLVGDHDILDFLHVLVNESADLLDVAMASVMLADSRGDLHVLASTNEECLSSEMLQQISGAGPCVECYVAGTTVTIRDIDEVAEQWPRFHSLARAQGFHSVHAIPMRLPSGTIGSLNLFSERKGVLSEENMGVGQALADVSAISIMQQRTIAETGLINEQLQRALESRVVIEQAKGMIAELEGIDINEAFQRLRSVARSNNSKLHDVAQAVLNRKRTV